MTRRNCCLALRATVIGLYVVASAGLCLPPRPVEAASAATIDQEVDAALKKLYQSAPEARTLAAEATAILVFPEVVKAGFMVGAQRGEGALRKRGKTVAYYRTTGGSYGLQAGVQKFGYAMFFMKPSALEYLEKSHGWEVGMGPSVVVVDTGKGKALTSTTAREDVYAFIFGQQGLMAGLGLQGSKITRIEP
jgi:lipid-binding SYLF domain-containing protein